MKIWLNDREVKESEICIPCHCCVFNKNISHNPFTSRCLLRTLNLRKGTTCVLEDIFMKIWRNDKRVVKVPKYIFCEDCALVGEKFDYSVLCLASHYGIHNSANVCLCGYKYETDV